MNKKRRSPIWRLSTEDFKELIENSKTYTEVLLFFNMKTQGGNSKTLKKRIREENVDISHFMTRSEIMKNLHSNKKIPLKKILVENSTYSRTNLKQRLIKNNSLEEKCDICNLKNEWAGMRLVLVLDHINGIHNDNRLDNLRLICPNCNSQTKTFSGRNHKDKYRIIKKCILCKKERNKASKKYCLDCYNKVGRKNKIKWPEIDALIRRVEEKSLSAIGRELNVSDNAIKKRIRKLKPEWKNKYRKVNR